MVIGLNTKIFLKDKNEKHTLLNEQSKRNTII